MISQACSLLLITIIPVILTGLPNLLLIPAERKLFLREYGTNHYSILAYFLARIASEILMSAIQMTIMASIIYHMIQYQMDFWILYPVMLLSALSGSSVALLLGCSVSSTLLAVELFPIILIPQLLFMGVLVAPKYIPAFLGWILYLSPAAFACRILLWEEFSGDCGSPIADSMCDYFLEMVQAEGDQLGFYWAMLMGLTLWYRLSALLVLHSQASTYYS